MAGAGQPQRLGSFGGLLDCTMTVHRRRTISVRNLISAGLTLAAVAGCSHSNATAPPEVVRASGTLAYRGQPVVDAQLTFWSDDLSEPAFALTDVRGEFRCMTNDTGDGMPPGEYVVTVSSSRGGIPDKYANVDSSPLHVTVDGEAATEFALVLED